MTEFRSSLCKWMLINQRRMLLSKHFNCLYFSNRSSLGTEHLGESRCTPMFSLYVGKNGKAISSPKHHEFIKSATITFSMCKSTTKMVGGHNTPNFAQSFPWVKTNTKCHLVFSRAVRRNYSMSRKIMLDFLRFLTG